MTRCFMQTAGAWVGVFLFIHIPAEGVESATATALRTNPLKTQADLAQAMRDLYEPMRSYRVPSGFDLGEFSARYGEKTEQCEAFLRPLWGLAPLAAGGGKFDHWAEWRATLIAATDPENPAFWGYITGGDQRAVEMAALASSLLLAPQETWDPLTEVQRANLVRWMKSIETCRNLKNNWIFFRVLVHLFFERQGLPYDTEQNHSDLMAIDHLYLGDGWYSDGAAPQRDYYVPMALHYYGLIYSCFAQEFEAERCQRFRERASLFADQFQHWFTPQGDAVPYGRSMTYRFAQSAFWSALVYAHVEPKGLTQGQVKGLLLRNLRWWFQQPIFTQGGILSVGYRYPNLMMSEPYNAPGSPYWATKTFLVLGLPSNDPFWQVAEEPLPARPAVSVQPQAGMIVTHDDARSHTVMLTSGQLAGFMATPSANKYAKFAYSSAFGFCALGPDGDVGGSGYDSVLSVSDDGRHYRSREQCEAVAVRGTTLASRWKPFNDVTIETWLAPVDKGHVRIHHITTKQPIHLCDAGFSLPNETKRSGKAANGIMLLSSDFGISAVRTLAGQWTPGSERMRPNLNLMHPLASVPTLTCQLEAGDYWAASAVVGIPDPQANAESLDLLNALSWVSSSNDVPSIVYKGSIVLKAEPIPAVHLEKTKGNP